MIKRIFSLILILPLWFVSVCTGQACCAAKAQVSCTPPKASVTSGAVLPEINNLLDRLEEAGDKLKSFQGRMRYELLQQIIDTQTVRNGKIYYRRGDGMVRARIHFADYLQQDLEDDEKAKVVKFDEDYVFDGLWVTRRNAQTKTIQSWEVSKKQRDTEAFRLGKGPFPLPFTIKKKDVLEHFEVTLVESDPKVPTIDQQADHLRLIPKKQSSYAEDYIAMDLWIDIKTSLPSRISFEKDDYEVSTVTWSRIEIDKKIKDKVFQLKKAGKDWSVEEVPLEEEPGNSAQKHK